MRRDVLGVGVLWLVLTIVGEVLAQADIYPLARADKAVEIEGAFRLLLVMAVPVFTFVIAVLAFSVLRYRSAGRPETDGPPMLGRGALPLAWFGITSGLAVLVMVNPGLVGLARVLREEPPDLLVKVEAFQWSWNVSYPEEGVSGVRELVLPADRVVRFEVTSLDVLHSFWIPAFLMKIDAVPGLTTSVTLRPTEPGSYEDDPNLRLQCAELCGLSHARMMLAVRIVTAGEFDRWAVEHGGGGAATPVPGGTELELVGRGSLFDSGRLEAPAGAPINLTFRNEDAGVVHNVALYEAGEGGQAIPGARTDLVPGPARQLLVAPALPAGTYLFRCDAHPAQMVTELVVK